LPFAFCLLPFAFKDNGGPARTRTVDPFGVSEVL
jgi:hypothetical protein